VRSVASSAKVPLICLPGLTRSTRDFGPVFELVRDRKVIAFDFRGRGLSDRADPLTYRPDVELADTISFLDHLGVARVAILGTSRGGIVGMLMAALHKPRMAGLLLNDIGPEIEVAGLKRIIGYVGKAASFGSWNEAALALAWSSTGFEHVSHDAWIEVARMIYAEHGGRIISEHDPLLSVNMPSIDQIEREGVKDMWALAPHLSALPLALLRGAGSDLLSAQTVLRMQAECPELVATEVPDRGHVPFLTEQVSRMAILAWLATVDA
jgi:pimeloyl-ACP methyl ester carboxylesterase